MNPENDICWTEVGSSFEELGGTLPLKVLIPPPRPCTLPDVFVRVLLVSENSEKLLAQSIPVLPNLYFLLLLTFSIAYLFID